LSAIVGKVIGDVQSDPLQIVADALSIASSVAAMAYLALEKKS
jgi:hypothetical protein